MMKSFENCAISRIDDDKKRLHGINIIVPADPNQGFNFPYVLFIPDEVSSQTNLIIEGANTGQSKENILEAVADVIKESTARKILEWNSETNFPILTPAFPRIYGRENGGIYTHMLTSQALNYKGKGLDRIDQQLIKMIADAKVRLQNNNIYCSEKVILDGFSASAKFVNRFALLHPEIVKLVIAGAISGGGILPIKQIGSELLLYPVGCGNIAEITDAKIELFKKIKHFYYMGELDPLDNDPLGEKADGSLISESAITRAEADQLYRFIGKRMLPERWQRLQQIYQELGINAIFETYLNTGHDPLPAQEKVIELLKSCSIEITENISQNHI